MGKERKVLSLISRKSEAGYCPDHKGEQHHRYHDKADGFFQNWTP